MKNKVKTVNQKNHVYIVKSVGQEVEKKLYRNFTAGSSDRFYQTVSWLRDYSYELNEIAGTSDFSDCEVCQNNNRIWQCKNNIGNLILRILTDLNGNQIVQICDVNLSSLIAPYTLVDDFKNNISDDEYCNLLMEHANAYWHNLFR